MQLYAAFISFEMAPLGCVSVCEGSLYGCIPGRHGSMLTGSHVCAMTRTLFCGGGTKATASSVLQNRVQVVGPACPVKVHMYGA